MIEYAAILFVTIAIASLDRAALWTSLVVGLNFIANESFVRNWPGVDPWWYLSITDGLAGILLVKGCRFTPDFGRVGAAVAAIYWAQVVAHFSYFLTPTASQYEHWRSLTAMAFVQLLILLVGGIHGGGRLARRRRAIRDVSALNFAADRRAAHDERGTGR